jgi:radical SAM protein with 4Fe4S-binding SPASM domain
VLSTNGTLITGAVAGQLKAMGLSYAGISIDGLEHTHDRFRGVEGAFGRAMRGVENCLAAGLKVGLRFTITAGNAHEIPGIFRLIRDRGIPRVCFYHLVYAGRGSDLAGEDLTRDQARQTVDLIIDRTRDLFEAGKEKEVLTVDNHADGPWLYLRLLREDPDRAARVYGLLRMNGGNSSGHGIGCVSWDGSVHPDQFWRHCTLGNVRERPFSEIWTDLSNPLLRRLRDRKAHVKGKCARCRFLEVCGGNFRVRAEAVYGDIWAEDPACYLTEEEISKE